MSKHARNPFHPAGENQSGTLVTFSLGQPWYRPAFHSPTPWTRNTILQRRALTFGAYFLWPSSDAPNNAPKNCGCTRLSADVKRRARKGSPLFARAWWTSTDCGERRRLGKWPGQEPNILFKYLINNNILSDKNKYTHKFTRKRHGFLRMA